MRRCWIPCWAWLEASRGLDALRRHTAEIAPGFGMRQLWHASRRQLGFGVRRRAFFAFLISKITGFQRQVDDAQ